LRSHAIERAQVRKISAANYLETAVVIDASRDPVASRRFDELVDTAELRVEPVTHDQARIARDAYRDFGKGSGHKASLNFGDCFAYAWQSPPEKRCCSREPTSATPTSRLRSSLRQTITPADPEW